MTILLITPLFPENLETPRTKTTFAIYELVRHWGIDTPLVIKPKKTSFKKWFTHKDKYSELDGIKVITVPYFKISLFNWIFKSAFAKRVHKILNKEGFNPDRIISHYHLSITLGEILSSRLKCPFFPVIHKRDILEMGRGNQKLYERSLASAVKIFCRSHALKKLFLERYPQYEDKLNIAGSGIPGEFILDKEKYLGKINQSGSRDTLYILTVASLIPLKNHKYVLRALADWEYDNWRYRIIGDGPERQNLEALVKDLDLDDKVSFLGQKNRNEVLELLNDSDVFVMVSETETFGIAYLEALAKACIVIGAVGWGIDGVVSHGRNGYLCEIRNSKEIKEALEDIRNLSDDQRRELANQMYETIVSMDENKKSAEYLRMVKE